MIKVKTIKTIATVIVGYGTKHIVMAIIKNNTKPENSKDKFAIGVGTFTMTAIAISASKDYTDRKIDAYYNAWLGLNKLKNEVIEDTEKTLPPMEVQYNAESINKNNPV